MECKDKYKSTQRWLLWLCLALNYVSALGQSIEIGYVKEYNGEQSKTPLAGVELSVVGAPSTVSDSTGKYELRFAVLKPGEPVKCNEIYKSGYVIFNQDALDYWRISRSRKPFIIVMCREDEFRQLKKRFYGIIEKSYKDEYLRQKALTEQTISDKIALEGKLKQLQKEYEEKLSNINIYVELFARIDRSEMDSIEAKTLKLVEAGKIEEGIRIYEELKLLEQTEEQLGKWISGENMKQAAEEMIADSQRDLITLAEKMQKQIGLYEMGGETYNEKRDSLMSKLIDVYSKLNQVMPGRFNEELGLYLCQYAVNTLPWSQWGKYFRQAASLPSSAGLNNLGNRFEMLTYDNPSFLDSARTCYRKALQMQLSDSLRSNIELRLSSCADFHCILQDGDTLYFKKAGTKDSVYITTINNYCNNRIHNETLKIPATVIHNGHKYHVTGISRRAFFKNRKLRKVVFPESLIYVGNEAFAKCDSLQLIVVGNSVQQWGKESIPVTTKLELPKRLQTESIVPLLYERIDWLNKNIKQKLSPRECVPTMLLAQHYYTREISHKDQHIDPYKRGELNYWMGSVSELARDTAAAMRYYSLACKDFADPQSIEYKTCMGAQGFLHYFHGNFAEAYKYFTVAADILLPAVYNILGYMYARGEYVEQNYHKALEQINHAISLAPQDANYLDSKGEIFLMMGKRDSAQVYLNRALHLDPDFSKLDSRLYQDLNPSETKKLKLLRKYVEVVQIIAKNLYNMQREAFYEIEYEEYLSIGIIAVQVMIRNKTEEQLAKYAPEYINSAIKWAISNELQFRYPWFSQYCYTKAKTRSQIENNVKREYLQKIFQVVQKIKSQPTTQNGFRSPSLEVWGVVKKRIDMLQSAQQQLAYDLIKTQDDLEDVARKHNTDIKTCESIVDYLFNGKKNSE